MSYLKVLWKHSLLTEPVVLYSELDGERWEVRKVEVYPDGRCGYASSAASFGGTRLSKEPLPELGDIAADSQFEPAEIGQKEFEEIWSRCR